MKQFYCGIIAGVLISIFGFAGFKWLGSGSALKVDHALREKNITYCNVDLNYNGLVLYDIGIKVDNDVFIKPKKLIQFLGKDIQIANEGLQMVINERPETFVADASVEVLKPHNKLTIGQVLSKTFLSQKWGADEKEEGVINFEGVNNKDIHYKIEFLIDKDQELTVRKIYENGIALSDEEKEKMIQKLFSK